MKEIVHLLIIVHLLSLHVIVIQWQPVVHNDLVGALFLRHFERFATLEISVVNL